MPWLGHDRYHAELEAETARLARAVAGADPARPVPTCPEWTLAQLAAHVGAGQRWAATIVERRATTPVPNAAAGDLEAPRDPDGRTAWLLAGARRLGDAVRDAGAEVSGPALDLLLVLNRRAAPGDAAVEVAGDGRLLAHWLSHRAFEG